LECFGRRVNRFGIGLVYWFVNRFDGDQLDIGQFYRFVTFELELDGLGVGPLDTVDFLFRFLEEEPANGCDQDE